MTPVRLEPAALRSRVKHSTTEPLRFLLLYLCVLGGGRDGGYGFVFSTSFVTLCVLTRFEERRSRISLLIISTFAIMGMSMSVY